MLAIQNHSYCEESSLCEPWGDTEAQGSQVCPAPTRGATTERDVCLVSAIRPSPAFVPSMSEAEMKFMVQCSGAGWAVIAALLSGHCPQWRWATGSAPTRAFQRSDSAYGPSSWPPLVSYLSSKFLLFKSGRVVFYCLQPRAK